MDFLLKEQESVHAVFFPPLVCFKILIPFYGLMHRTVLFCVPKLKKKIRLKNTGVFLGNDYTIKVFSSSFCKGL